MNPQAPTKQASRGGADFELVRDPLLIRLLEDALYLGIVSCHIRRVISIHF